MRYFGEFKDNDLDTLRGGEQFCRYLEDLSKAAFAPNQSPAYRGFVLASDQLQKNRGIDTASDQILMNDSKKTLLAQTSFAVFASVFPQILGVSPIRADLKGMMRPQSEFQPAILDLSLRPLYSFFGIKEKWEAHIEIDFKLQNSISVCLERIVSDCSSFDENDVCLVRIHGLEMKNSVAMKFFGDGCSLDISASISLDLLDCRIKPIGCFLILFYSFVHIILFLTCAFVTPALFLGLQSILSAIQVARPNPRAASQQSSSSRIKLQLLIICPVFGLNCFVSKVWLLFLGSIYYCCYRLALCTLDLKAFHFCCAHFLKLATLHSNPSSRQLKNIVRKMFMVSQCFKVPSSLSVC